MDTTLKLRNRVKELRARLGIRQADLAREVGVTRQSILAIEKGRLNPSVLVCLKIARVLREPVDYVFYLAPAPATSLAITTANAPAMKGTGRPHTSLGRKREEQPQAVFEFV